MGASSRGNHDYADRKRARRQGNMDGSAISQMLGEVAAAAEAISRDAIDALGSTWAQRESTIFDTGSYGRWRPLKADTILRKRREGKPLKILVREQTLRGELTKTEPRAEGARFVVFGPHNFAAIQYVKHHIRESGHGKATRNPVPQLLARERTVFMEILRDSVRPDFLRKGATFGVHQADGSAWKGRYG